MARSRPALADAAQAPPPAHRKEALSFSGSPAAKCWTLRVLGGLGCAPLASWAAEATRKPDASRRGPGSKPLAKLTTTARTTSL